MFRFVQNHANDSQKTCGEYSEFVKKNMPELKASGHVRKLK